MPTYALKSDLTTEINARKTADSGLTDRITNEVNNRASADTSLANRITALEAANADLLKRVQTLEASKPTLPLAPSNFTATSGDRQVILGWK